MSRKPSPPSATTDMAAKLLAAVVDTGSLAAACSAVEGGPVPIHLARRLIMSMENGNEMLDEAVLAHGEIQQAEARALLREMKNIADERIDLKDAPTDIDERKLWLEVKKLEAERKLSVRKFIVGKMMPDAPKVAAAFYNDNRQLKVNGKQTPLSNAFLERSRAYDKRGR